jgi:hypothetical protein
MVGKKRVDFAPTLGYNTLGICDFRLPISDWVLAIANRKSQIANHRGAIHDQNLLPRRGLHRQAAAVGD